MTYIQNFFHLIIYSKKINLLNTGLIQLSVNNDMGNPLSQLPDSPACKFSLGFVWPECIIERVEQAN